MPEQRMYIGARYVPLYMGEWDNTVTYEPLSIVSNDGNSYTSRTFVPSGIPIDNDFYWALTGSSAYTLPTMSQNTKGGAKLGAGLAVADDTLSLSGESYTSEEKTKLEGIEANANDYTLPTMGASTKGGAKLGAGLAVADDTLYVKAVLHTKVITTETNSYVSPWGAYKEVTGFDNTVAAFCHAGSTNPSSVCIVGSNNIIQVYSKTAGDVTVKVLTLDLT